MFRLRLRLGNCTLWLPRPAPKTTYARTAYVPVLHASRTVFFKHTYLHRVRLSVDAIMPLNASKINIRLQHRADTLNLAAGAVLPLRSWVSAEKLSWSVNFEGGEIFYWNWISSYSFWLENEYLNRLLWIIHLFV